MVGVTRRQWRRVNAACLPTLGSADNNDCSTLDRVKHACWSQHVFDLHACDPISYVRCQGASDAAHAAGQIRAGHFDAAAAQQQPPFLR